MNFDQFHGEDCCVVSCGEINYEITLSKIKRACTSLAAISGQNVAQNLPFAALSREHLY